MHALSLVGAANVAAINSGMMQGVKARGVLQGSVYRAKPLLAVDLSFGAMTEYQVFNSSNGTEVCRHFSCKGD